MAKLSKGHFHIELSMSVAKTIDSYFSNAKEAIATYEEYLHRLRSLDFSKMRGFLRTTFNTLQEIDPEFMSSNVLAISKKINAMADIYDDFVSKTKMGMYSYDRIFLHRQTGYSASEGRLKHNSDEIAYLKSLMKDIGEQIPYYKSILDKLPKSSSEYEQKELELKALKRRENNVITRYGQLVEENAVLSDVLLDFKDLHHEAFATHFTSYIKEVKPKITTILDAMAFEFEIVLWHKAKESQIIREFFKSANSGEVISSRTFLRYYLRKLDETKLSKENQALQNLFDYLNKVTVINVLLCISNKDDLDAFDAALVADASGFHVEKCEDARCAMKILLTQAMDILVLDTDTNIDELVALAKQFRENSKRSAKKGKIILMAGEINERTIATAQELKADSLIEREIDPIEIIDMVYAILKG